VIVDVSAMREPRVMKEWCKMVTIKSEGFITDVRMAANVRQTRAERPTVA
jgi:hypothetical protein